MSIERFGGIRIAIAAEAARLMYEENVKQYFTAKRIAAKRILGRAGGQRMRYRPADLPSNGEIRDALLLLAELAEGSGRTRALFAMRVVALEAMKAIVSSRNPHASRLALVEARLIGSVSTGHIRRGSDVDIQVFTDDEGALELRLDELGWPFERERVAIQKFGECREYVHYHVDDRFALELTVYALSDLRHRPRSSTDGKPIERFSITKLEAMLAREHREAWREYLASGAIEGLEEALAGTDEDAEAHGPFDGLLESTALDDDEEPCIPEPGEEDDPLQAYEPLPGFEEVT